MATAQRLAGIKKLRADKSPPQGPVNEEFANPASQPECLTLASRFSDFLARVLDSFSSFFFCLSFTSLTHLIGSLWNRFLAEQ
jgi:hypothetical protein